jgi:hypothetical protein
VINQIDLAKLEGYSVRLEKETPEDADARRSLALDEASHKRRIHFWLIILAILLVVVTFIFCGYVLLTGLPEDKKWASTIATIIVTALCSGLFGVELGKRSA